jgi:hypothetical protein
MPRIKKQPLPKIEKTGDIQFGKRIAFSKFRKAHVQKRLLEALSLGCYIKEAAHYAGVTYETYKNWYNGDKKFREEVEIAIAKSEALLLAEIRRDPSWQSKAWILERRFRERWGRDNTHSADSTPRTITLSWSGEVGLQEGNDRTIEAAPSKEEEASGE